MSNTKLIADGTVSLYLSQPSGLFLPLARFVKYLGLGLLSFTPYELALRREGQVFN